MTIPGIGYYSAVLMKSEIGDINRFVFPDRLVVTLGWCLLRMLLVRLFGMEESLRRKAGGCVGLWLRLLRLMLHKCDTAITKAYNRIAEKRGKKIATVAAARRLLMVSFSVLKNREPFYDQA